MFNYVSLHLLPIRFDDSASSTLMHSNRQFTQLNLCNKSLFEFKITIFLLFRQNLSTECHQAKMNGARESARLSEHEKIR